MLTLTEAVAKLDRLLARVPDVDETHYDEKGNLTFHDSPLSPRIRAAVRNVALATEQLGQDGFRHSEIVAKIIRLLGSATSK